MFQTEDERYARWVEQERPGEEGRGSQSYDYVSAGAQVQTPEWLKILRDLGYTGDMLQQQQNMDYNPHAGVDQFTTVQDPALQKWMQDNGLTLKTENNAGGQRSALFKGDQQFSKDYQYNPDRGDGAFLAAMGLATAGFAAPMAMGAYGAAGAGAGEAVSGAYGASAGELGGAAASYGGAGEAVSGFSVGGGGGAAGTLGGSTGSLGAGAGYTTPGLGGAGASAGVGGAASTGGLLGQGGVLGTGLTGTQLVQGGLGVASNLYSQYNAGKGLDAQKDYANNALGLQRDMYNQTRADWTPYREMGYGATGLINGLMANPNSITSDPGYQFRFNQGQQALERSAGAKGGLYSGAQMKAQTRFGQDNATAELDNAFRRYGNVAQLGATGVNGSAQAGMNYANQGANIQTGMGNSALGASLYNGANWQNTLNGLASMWGDSTYGKKQPG